MLREIPKEEFVRRTKVLQKKMSEENLDVAICVGHEAEPAYIRYFSNYAPSFESAGVLIPREGEAVLLIGPETENLARIWSRLERVEQLIEFREAAEPDYPGVNLTTFDDLFKEYNTNDKLKKIGIIGSNIMYINTYNSILNAAKRFNAEVIPADKLGLDMRQNKSEIEIELLRNAFKISEVAMKNVISKVKPGMTEIEVTGIMHNEIRQAGAEGEGFPFWCLTGNNSGAAIGKPSHKKIERNEIVVINTGCRLGGYASNVSRPICFGNPDKNVKDLLKIGLEAEKYMNSILRPEIPAKEVAIKFKEFIFENGFENYYLYGPCHSSGLMESEAPWIEENSEYILKKNMTFNFDIYLGNSEMGLRYEDGTVLIDNGVENFSNIEEEIIII